MKFEKDSEWPDKLQSAVFSINTQFKRATGSTAFRLMFGRECNPFPLLNLISGAHDDTQDTQNHYFDDEETVLIYVLLIHVYKLVFYRQSQTGPYTF